MPQSPHYVFCLSFPSWMLSPSISSCCRGVHALVSRIVVSCFSCVFCFIKALSLFFVVKVSAEVRATGIQSHCGSSRKSQMDDVCRSYRISLCVHTS